MKAFCKLKAEICMYMHLHVHAWVMGIGSKGVMNNEVKMLKQMQQRHFKTYTARVCVRVPCTIFFSAHSI